MVAYHAHDDVTAFLPAGGLPNPARVATGSAAGDYIESDGHGLVANSQVTFRAEADGSLPAPLVAGTVYFAIVVSSSRFQVSATSGGSAINLTTDGDNFVFASELPWDAWGEWASRQVDSFLPVHMIPLATPYPAIVVTASAELAAMRGLAATAGSSIDLGPRIDAVGARIARWAKGVPVRGAAKQVAEPSNLAVTAAAGAYDPRGWGGCDDKRIP